MRVQISYQRFWEGATQCAQAASKWGDAAAQLLAFDEFSAQPYSEEGIAFRSQASARSARPLAWPPPRVRPAEPRPPRRWCT